MSEVKTIAFTGHRQNKLNGYQATGWARDRLASIIERAYKSGYTRFICGGALGVDWIAADEVLSLGRTANPPVKLILALPFNGYYSRWPLETIERFELEIVEQADQVVYVSEPPYAVWKMHKRNEWMIERCDVVIAVYDRCGEGGTARAVDYARSRRVIYHINPRTKAEGWGLQ